MTPGALDTSDLLEGFETLLDDLAARRPTARFAAVTREIDPGVDPSAIAFGSRRAGDRWFCWEHPDRGRFALAAMGSAAEIVSRGPERFDDAASGCARAAAAIVHDGPQDLPDGAGPVFTGGFAFAPHGASEPQWSSLPPALMVLPELSVWRRGDRAYATAVADVTRDGVLNRARARLASLVSAALPAGGAGSLRDGVNVRSARKPSAYEDAVTAAIERIKAGAAEKIVLAREVLVGARSAHDPGPAFGALRELFPECFCFCAGTPEAAFIGASPELLVRRSGAVAATVALAGSTRRSADPAVDDHLGEGLLRSAKDREEHEIVVRRIERTLRSFSVWVDADSDPVLAKVANIQHLATPIRAQLADARSAIELAGSLHPTPAVGGEPRDRALDAIDELEGMDRGWYAAPVGWMDATDNGEFCVALRSALLRDRTAHLFAGAGIVAASDPSSELAETELKLEAMLPLLS